jgi:uncharacterized membrane protein YgdD (TMEM256/DUF423 family)
MIIDRLPARISAALAFLAVALGAFGSHALKATLAARATTAIWEKAVFYHLVHAVVLWILAARNGPLPRAWWLFASGILLFSGSLYAIALADLPAFGPITPVGGLCLLGAWLWLAINPSRNADQ